MAMGQDKQKTYIILKGNFLCLSCPSATFVLQHGSFVPRQWLAAKGLFLFHVFMDRDGVEDREKKNTYTKKERGQYPSIFGLIEPNKLR